MAVIQMLKETKRFLKLVLLRVFRLFNSIRYLYFKPNAAPEVSLEAHLLVVKKGVYAAIAKICVESFLYFNPRSRVVIHVDSITFDGVSKKLKKLISRDKVKILFVENEDLPWQDLKLSLIFSLGDSESFFMDADLKWNGPIGPISGITLLVEEFRFENNLFYTPLFDSDFFKSYINCTMKNTSFFYWGGHIPKDNYKRMIHEIMNEIRNVTTDSKNSEEFNLSTQRISEQIALSLMVDSTGEKVNFLKKTDGFKDGSFVESSYFGVTGTSF